MSQDAAKNRGGPLAAIDRGWTAIELTLAVWIVVLEIVTLVGWVALKGLATSEATSGSTIGTLVRGTMLALALGTGAHFLVRPRPGGKGRPWHPAVVIAAMLVGILSARLLSEIGVAWCSNFVSWLQNASVLALMGGPRGVVTRFTLWLALLGASLAASRGKHISIDVALRYLPQRLLAPAAVLGWTAAALVCFAGAWGFLDSIAVTKFRAEAFQPCAAGEDREAGLCETSRSDRVVVVLKDVRKDLFLFGRQVSLDLMTLPHVFAGRPYDTYLTPAIWNDWVKSSDFVAHYPEDQVAGILIRADDPPSSKMPLISEPGTGEGRDLLIRDLNFILPFGLMMIGLKMLLRSLRVLGGELKVDPDAAHDDDSLKHAHDHDKDVASAGAKA